MNEVMQVVGGCLAWGALCALECVLFYVLPLAVDRAEKKGGAK